MPARDYMETLITAGTDGTALTAAARNSALPAAAIVTLPPNFFDFIGKQVLLKASGKVSVVITTPGTLRFDVNFLDSAAANAIVSDTGAILGNIVAKTDTPFYLELLLTCRAIGTSANIMTGGYLFTAATILTAAIATGPGPGGSLYPWNAAPVVGANFNSTLAQQVDLRFTQTVATGSLTLQQYSLIRMN